MPFKNQHPLYNVWKSMRDRCLNPRSRAWKDYGGRGITICKRWDSFPAWLADMGPRPPGMLIDRINNDGNYEPENCRWTTRRENQLNRRLTIWLTIDGKRHRLADLAMRSGLKADTIKARVAKGLSLAAVLSPARRVHAAGLSLGGKANGARQKAKTHCINGHPFDEANTFHYRGARSCRACKREAARRRKASRG